MHANAFCFPVLMLTAAASAQAPTAPPPQSLAQGVELLRGAILPGRGPDGNTVVFDAPEGIVVIDTGRHDWHSDAILALARERKRPIAAIVNTHWHLDHTSGNGRLKAAFPGARVYSTNAIDRALAEGGFLARNLESTKAMLDDPKVDDLQKEEMQVFIATMAESDVLRPDVVLASDERRTIGGREFDLHVTKGAVSDADVWLYDRASGVAVIGDLVTLPSPFFETACPDRWREALDAVWVVPFTTAIPGHGEPMTRAQFDAWRGSFNAYMDCVAGTATPGQCAAAWVVGIAQFIDSDEGGRKSARAYAEYYVGMLREGGGKSGDCTAQ